MKKKLELEEDTGLRISDCSVCVCVVKSLGVLEKESVGAREGLLLP